MHVKLGRKRPRRGTHEPMTCTIQIREDWCKGCGICIALCKQGVLGNDFASNKAIVVAPEKCTKCGTCVIHCPDFAIRLEGGQGKWLGV